VSTPDFDAQPALQPLATQRTGRRAHLADLTTERPWVRWTVVAIGSIFLGIFLVLPLVSIFSAALSSGISAYFDALRDPDAVSAIRLTLIVALISVPLNTVFGFAVAWTIARFGFMCR